MMNYVYQQACWLWLSVLLELIMGVFSDSDFQSSITYRQPGPSRGGRGSFPGPRDVWGTHRRSEILKMVFQVASS